MIQTPFEYLVSVDQKIRARTSGATEQEHAWKFWAGVAFKLRDIQFVAPMNEVQEVLDCPDLLSNMVTRIPGTHPWILGTTNIRGRLLPLIDLATFFGLPKGTGSVKKRILVLEIYGIFCGVVVDGVQGLRRFDGRSYDKTIPANVPASLHGCMAGSYRWESEYLIFSFTALMNNQQFLKTVTV